MTLLDTSFLIDVLRNKKDAVELLEKLENNEPLFVASVSVMELWEGVIAKRSSNLEKQRVEECLSSMSIIDFDAKAAKRSAEISVALFRTPLETEDVMIAAIALVNGETVVTRDEHFVRVPGLRVLKYG